MGCGVVAGGRAELWETRFSVRVCLSDACQVRASVNVCISKSCDHQPLQSLVEVKEVQGEPPVSNYSTYSYDLLP